MWKHSDRNGRRRWPRHSLDAPARLATDTVTIPGRCVTMSGGGVCIFAVANLPIGAHVEIEFAHQPSREMVRAAGVIRNRAAYLYGIEFLAGEIQAFPS
ncbi:MAG TPA: PilZ domain-containing protein [Terriglobales bacterium]|nr:PilZ domain-containing protein [Terriglobales bacterium]